VALLLLVSLYPASQLGSEFMPTLNEGSLLYMPASLPGMSITKAAELMQTQDKIIKSFPEVESVFGNQGAHRHAVHRHSHTDRHQGVWQGPGGNGKAGQAD
jgi:Cu/Ag efflux pump CusA